MSTTENGAVSEELVLRAQHTYDLAMSAMHPLSNRTVPMKAALQAALGSSPWRPIAEAPKDGTAILVCNAAHYDTNGFLPVAVRWRAYHPNSKGAETWRDSCGVKVGNATHFQPLPAPPATGDQP